MLHSCKLLLQSCYRNGQYGHYRHKKKKSWPETGVKEPGLPTMS